MNKKELYNSIMEQIAPIVRKAINESALFEEESLNKDSAIAIISRLCIEGEIDDIEVNTKNRTATAFILHPTNDNLGIMEITYNYTCEYFEAWESNDYDQPSEPEYIEVKDLKLDNVRVMDDDANLEITLSDKEIKEIGLSFDNFEDDIKVEIIEREDPENWANDPYWENDPEYWRD